ncbi:hypothetical protein [Micromonospora haikouensis]|uniref:hypothetical protein n=1 Tax=Micromonospora haikouensis TaxID=686309 RepID=UPI003D8D8C2B
MDASPQAPAPAAPQAPASDLSPEAPEAPEAPERARPEPPAWQGLPPIQRVVPDEPRLNRPDTFTGSLAAWRDPSYLAPLGHLVGTAEPAGVLHDAAVPVSDPPPPSDPGLTGQPGGGDPATLPLAVPGPGPTTRPLQRQVADAWAGRQVGTASTGEQPGTTRTDRPQAGQPPGRPVPVEPVPTVSRLLTAPPPPEALHLPAVALPTDPPPAAAWPDGPADPPQSPTLGVDAPPADDAAPSNPAPSTQAPNAATPSAAAPGGVLPGPAAALADGGAGREVPVQRVPGDADRPRRRLGLGEPIVSPVSPGPGPTGNPVLPPLQRSTAEAGTPPVHRSSTGNHVPPLVQRFPAEPGGQRADAAGPGPSGSAASRPGGQTSVGGLPVAGSGSAGPPPAPSVGDSTDAGTEATPSVQPYVPPSGESFAPLLGQPSESTPVGVDPTGASPGPGHPGGRAPDGGGAVAAEPAGDRGAGAGGTTGPDLPLVVARLVGDRSPPLLTGAVPAAPAPQQPSVQRVTWQRDETPAPAPAARVAAPEPRGPESAVSVQSHAAPGDPGTHAPTGADPAGVGDAAPAGGGLPPVQRWVGALPGTPPGSLPGGIAGAPSGTTAGAFSGTAPGAGRPATAPPTGDTASAGPPLSAYPMVMGAVVQRAEAFDEPPPPADPPAPPADPPAPPADGPGGAAAAGQPAAPGGPAAAGGGVEPEELLKKLYDPLLRRLKTELRLDRERHGVLGGPG